MLIVTKKKSFPLKKYYSHLDEADVKPVNIHESIDSSILILDTRIKEKSDKSKIEIVRNYGNLPQVICQISQIHQVFMNLLINERKACR